MHTEQVEFKNDSGIVLRGVLHHALGAPRAIALFAHCFTCTAKSKAAVTVSRRLATHGITVLGSSIIGLEEHTPENIDEVIDHAVRHDTDFHQFMLYTPSPGTPLYAELTELGLMK